LTHGGRAAQQEHWKIGELVLSFFFGEVLGRGMRRRTIARAVVGNREADELGDQRQEAVEVWEEQDVNSRRWQVLMMAGGAKYQRKMAKVLLGQNVSRTRRELDVGKGA